MRTASFSEFQQAIQGLRGKKAWRSRAGSSAGSIFTMKFGAETASVDSDSNFSLMVFCAWRIAQRGCVLCTWHEDADATLAPALKALEGVIVANVELTEWGDLTIDFQDGHSLHIWNDAPFKDSDSWNIVCSGLGYYSVETRNAFFYEPIVD